MANTAAIFTIVVFIFQTCNLGSCFGGNIYTNETKLLEDLLGSGSGYNPVIRPRLAEESYTEVRVGFSIIAIMELDSVTQRFSVNGLMMLKWTDEILTWNPDDYGGIDFIRPNPDQMWRPRIVLSNTDGNRDLFKDDFSPTIVTADGTVDWWPGSLFSGVCTLDVYKYPFDTQVCSLEFFSMGLTNTEIRFETTGSAQVDYTWYHENGEFEAPQSETAIVIKNNVTGPIHFDVNITLRRRPAYFLINVILPIIIISFLNILVFAIPLETDEKLNYSMTLLLTLLVFMGTISSQLPPSSIVIPLITIHILVQLIESAATVVLTLWVIRLSSWVESETKSRQERAVDRFKGITRRIKLLNRSINPTMNTDQHKRMNQVKAANGVENLNTTDLSQSRQSRLLHIMNSLTTAEKNSSDPESAMSSHNATPIPEVAESYTSKEKSDSDNIFIPNRNCDIIDSNCDRSRLDMRRNDGWAFPVVCGGDARVGGGCGPESQNHEEQDDDLERLEFWRTVAENFDTWALRIVFPLWLIQTLVFAVVLLA